MPWLFAGVRRGGVDERGPAPEQLMGCSACLHAQYSPGALRPCLVWDKHRKSDFSVDYFPGSIKVLSRSVLHECCMSAIARKVLSHGFTLDPKSPVSSLVLVYSTVCKLALFTGELERNFRWLMNDPQILNIVV